MPTSRTSPDSRFTIEAPLMVFDRVHRRTGTVERLCVFSNRAPEDLQLEIHYSFPEHSWLQVYGPTGRENDDWAGSSLRLLPGRNEVVLSFNTDSFHFPEKSFRGRLTFIDKGDSGASEGLEFCFAEVEDLKPFLGYAAIDLGTSSSTVALYHLRRDAVTGMPMTPRLGVRDAELPSAVFVRDFEKFRHRVGEGSFAGEEALAAHRAGRAHDARCLQLGTKRLVGLDRVLVSDEKGIGGYVDPRDILCALGKHLRRKTQNHPSVHAVLERVSVTFPPTWSYVQIRHWKELFRSLGFPDEGLDVSLDEASAAGLFYIYSCVRRPDRLRKLVQDLLHSEREISERGQKGKQYELKLICFDFGGGTIDLAFIEARFDLFPKLVKLHLRLLGSDSLSYGGDQVTLSVFRILKRRLALALCDPSRLRGDLVDKSRAGAEEEKARAIGPPAPPGFLDSGDAESFLLPEGRTAGASAIATRSEEASAETIRENWGYLCEHVWDPEIDPRVDDAVDHLFPTRFRQAEQIELSRLLEVRRNFNWLWEKAEDLKKRLFADVQRQQGGVAFPSFDDLPSVRRGIRLDDAPDVSLAERIPWAADAICERIIHVAGDEVWNAISEPLREAVARARRLSEPSRIDRVVLSGQSARIPMVRWLLSLARAEGGLGVAPANLEFDEENAKAGVSKGACLLHVMRDTLVGLDVDVADFKACLLADIYYLEVDGARKVLFEAGCPDDLAYVEDVPDAASFPRYLTIFGGCGPDVLGQFVFSEEGEALPPVPASSQKLPSQPDLLALRESNRERYRAGVSEFLKWTERERIAWIEKIAPGGNPGEIRYRYYLSRNQSLFVVRDAGTGGKRLFCLHGDPEARYRVDPAQDPFSGVH